MGRTTSIGWGRGGVFVSVGWDGHKYGTSHLIGEYIFLGQPVLADSAMVTWALRADYRWVLFLDSYEVPLGDVELGVPGVSIALPVGDLFVAWAPAVEGDRCCVWLVGSDAAGEKVFKELCPPIATSDDRLVVAITGEKKQCLVVTTTDAALVHKWPILADGSLGDEIKPSTQ